MNSSSMALTLCHKSIKTLKGASPVDLAFVSEKVHSFSDSTNARFQHKRLQLGYLKGFMAWVGGHWPPMFERGLPSPIRCPENPDNCRSTRFVEAPLEIPHHAENFVESRHFPKEHILPHGLVILFPRRNLAGEGNNPQCARTQRRLRLFASAEEHGAVSRDSGEKLKVCDGLFSDTFGDKAPQIVIVTGKPCFWTASRRPECFFMQQHGLFPKSALRLDSADRKEPAPNNSGECLFQIRLNLWQAARLGVGTRPQFNFDDRTNVSGIAIGGRVMEEQRLTVGISFIVQQIPG